MSSAYDFNQNGEFPIPQPHPYLHEPILFVSNIPAYIRDEDLALAFVTCAPFRPNIQRDGSDAPVGGTIEFKFQEKAEKALATLQSRPLPGLQSTLTLNLSPYPPTNPPIPLPPPSAYPRLVKHLPPGYTDSALYDIFRPFGALASVRAQTQFGPDTGMVEFWDELDAKHAEAALHCADVEGSNIAVQIYQPRRTASGSEFSPNAPTFVPSGSVPYSYTYSPPRPNSYPVRSPVQQMQFVHGPGQQVQVAPTAGPGSNSHSGLIDPCNLFCKNLDPEIDSNSLFTHFRQFGHIVSARVMRNENGESRGFGFVSFQIPESANAALHAMNGAQLGSKQIVVRLHEPKQLRQEKLAQRFGHGGRQRNSSGATSPTVSEAGDSYGGWSPRLQSTTLGSPSSTLFELRPDHRRRGSGSYYNAALSGNLNLPMRYDELASLTPVVRKEVLTGELSRRVKTLGSVPARDVDSVVDSLVNFSLSEVLNSIQDPDRLAEQVQNVRGTLQPISMRSSPNKSPSPSVSASQDSRLGALNAAASAPEHPGTPLSAAASLSSPPRTSSPAGSLPPASERDRLAAAVARLEPTRQAALTDLLMSLPKRERAMCLFNNEVLRAKLADAKAVLDSEEDEDGTAVQPTVVPRTPQAKKTAPLAVDSPHTPELSLRVPSAAASPFPETPVAQVPYSIASLAKLPAAEIIKIARSSSATGLPLPKEDPLVVRATDEFIDGLRDKSIQAQKQMMGEKLWRVIKSFGIKGAPKLTIALLDQDDLRPLAHLMNSYPSVLKEKALYVQSEKGGK